MRTRHGELDIRSISNAPDLTGYEAEQDEGRVIVGHSETGAVHVIESKSAKIYRKKGAAIAYLCLEKPEELRHDGHRHETVKFDAGWHEVVVKRQYSEDAQGWANVSD